MTRLRLALEILFLALLLSASFFAVRDHAREDSPTMDEPYHAFAAAEYVLNGTYWINIEHPPLAKDLAGAAMRSLDLEPPAGGDSAQMTPHNSYNEFLYGNRVDADTLVNAARRPFVWLFLLLILVVYAIARALFGPAAAVLAAGIIALDPNFAAHAGVVHTDVGAALTMTLASALALLAMRSGRKSHWVLTGVAIGLALVTKFSTIVLIPAILVLAFVVNHRRGRQAISDGLAGAAAAIGIALIITTVVYAWNMRAMPRESARKAVQLFLTLREAPEPVIDHHVFVSSISPPLGHWYAGIRGVALLSREGRGVNYFRGRISDGGFALYFPAAFLVKSTPAFLVLLALALILGWRSGRTLSALVLILPALLIFLLGLGSSFNIGVRHILPLYPPLAIIAAGALAASLPPRWFAVTAAVLLVAASATLANIHPHEFGYYNTIAGGPGHGREWFVDSSTDWGQDLKRLGGHLRDTGMERHTTVVALSGLATNYYARCRILDSTKPIEGGHYAISVLMQAIGPPFLRELDQPQEAAQLEVLLREIRRRGTRIGTIGTSIDLFLLPKPEGAPQITDRSPAVQESLSSARRLPNEPHTSRSSDLR